MDDDDNLQELEEIRRYFRSLGFLRYDGELWGVMLIYFTINLVCCAALRWPLGAGGPTPFLQISLIILLASSLLGPPIGIGAVVLMQLLKKTRPFTWLSTVVAIAALPAISVLNIWATSDILAGC